MRRTVERLRWNAGRSTWSEYADTNSYDPENRDRKLRFVREAARSQRRAVVWDLGCNTGEYSRAVRESADLVVALDADHLAIERLYRALAQENDTTILPLVADLTNPSPGVGWRNLERRTLLDRTRPDLILALALIHHLAIARNVPLPEIVDWLASFGSEVVVEFPGPGDPMVQRLLRNRGDLDFGYTRARFEAELERHFSTVAVDQLLSGQRTIYHLRPRAIAG
jgi:hypothetical protein